MLSGTVSSFGKSSMLALHSTLWGEENRGKGLRALIISRLAIRRTPWISPGVPGNWVRNRNFVDKTHLTDEIEGTYFHLWMYTLDEISSIGLVSHGIQSYLKCSYRIIRDPFSSIPFFIQFSSYIPSFGLKSQSYLVKAVNSWQDTFESCQYTEEWV